MRRSIVATRRPTGSWWVCGPKLKNSSRTVKDGSDRVNRVALRRKAMDDLPPRRAADFAAVEDRFFTLRNFPLTDGTVMPEATIAYETYGRPAPGGRNAILCTHGYTGSHHFAGRNPANGNQPGSWDGLIGPGKAIDTDKLFVVASNMLGSSFGSTNAGSINLQTGEVYGPAFPNVTIRDIVAAQKDLRAHLGVRHVLRVAGPPDCANPAVPLDGGTTVVMCV